MSPIGKSEICSSSNLVLALHPDSAVPIVTRTRFNCDLDLAHIDIPLAIMKKSTCGNRADMSQDRSRRPFKVARDHLKVLMLLARWMVSGPHNEFLVRSLSRNSRMANSRPSPRAQGYAALLSGYAYGRASRLKRQLPAVGGTHRRFTYYLRLVRQRIYRIQHRSGKSFYSAGNFLRGA